MKYSNKVTACLVVCNEEYAIRRCLESIKKVTDTILVLHDGKCTDNTINICNEYDINVIIGNKKGIPELHRSTLYSLTKTEWILQLDADEYLSDELISQIGKLLTEDVDCYSFIWPYWNGYKYKTFTWPYKKALFKTKSIEYLGFIHEEVRCNKVKQVPFIIHHKPNYNKYSPSMHKVKWQKWVNYHAYMFLINPERLPRFPSNNKLKPHYYLASIHPLLFAPLVALYHFAASYLLGGLREGISGFKISLYESLYYYYVFVKVHKLKK